MTPASTEPHEAAGIDVLGRRNAIEDYSCSGISVDDFLFQ
jgi:hypothetical protein